MSVVYLNIGKAFAVYAHRFTYDVIEDNKKKDNNH